MYRLDLLEEDAVRSTQDVPFESLAGKTILITGASGIIGTHLLCGLQHTHRELKLGIKVVAVVRHGVPEHLRPLQESGCVHFICGDLTDRDVLGALPGAHAIVHGATYGQPGLFMAEAVGTLKLNTTATVALMEKLLPGGHFLFLSSSEVYSGLSAPPYREDQIGTTNTTHPRSCYIEAKRCGEAICNAFRLSGADAKSARLCLAYGPGTRRGDKRVMNTFIERGLCNGAIEMMDRGEARRTYGYVADSVNMLWRILLQGKQAVYNVGGVSATTIADLARLVGRLLNVDVRIPAGAGRGLSGSPDDVRLDLARFGGEFGTPCFLDLEAGVARTIAWQKSLYG